MSSRIAILLDGGFVTKRLTARLGHFPKAKEVVEMTRRILRMPRLASSELLRVHYYDAPPLGGRALNPLDGSIYDFGAHRTHHRNQQLQESLAVTEDFAVRRGEVILHGWKLRKATLGELAAQPRALTALDLVPDIEQKGVDLRIGMDVAALALKRTVTDIVIATGDTDLVPALKFARREGVRVLLDTLGYSLKTPLREHADLVFDSFEGHERDPRRVPRETA